MKDNGIKLLKSLISRSFSALCLFSPSIFHNYLHASDNLSYIHNIIVEAYFKVFEISLVKCQILGKEE